MAELSKIMDIKNNILLKIHKKDSDIFMNKYRNREVITWGILIQAYIDYGLDSNKYLKINNNSISNKLVLLFDKPYYLNWYTYFFNLIDCKRCNKCGIIKLHQDFSKNRYICKSCENKNSLLYRINNPGNETYRTAKRRAIKKQAKPKWYEKELVTELYKKSSKEIHIDRIIPLVNKLVCGLHCIDNLQAIPVKENLSKHNSFNQYKQSQKQYEWCILNYNWNKLILEYYNES